MSSKLSQPYFIKVGARDSPLSRVQVQEIGNECQEHHPHTVLVPTFVRTYGDLDRHTSLRTLDKTDFFTREIDQMVLQQQVRLGIHSAKDLPHPLPQGLRCVALTPGIDPSDALVLRQQAPLLPGSVVATSSLHREQAVSALYPGIHFVDLRGTIGERLQKLEMGEVDGVVIAEAALIRLHLTHLPRVRLPGPTTPLQGRLAVLAAESDEEMQHLFSWAAPKEELLLRNK